MVIVPKEDFLELDAVLKNKDTGFVREGFSAEIKVHTFPLTKYGIIDAEVIGITADTNDDEKKGLVYKMRLKMKSKHLYVNGQWIAWLVESCRVWRWVPKWKRASVRSLNM